MDRTELSRRQILAGLAVTGSSGALVGSGTGALFSDTESFTNNSIRASESSAGVVDLNVAIESSEDNVIFTVDLPTVTEDSFGNSELPTNNNPAYIWIRSSCPDPPELASLLTVDVSVECIVGEETTSETIFEEITAYDVLTGAIGDPDLGNLREGLLLACDGDKCLQPENERRLILESKGYACEYTPEEDDFDNLSFNLEFAGEQCRYESESTLESPFPDDLSSCDEPDLPYYGISYIEIYGCKAGGTPKNEPIGKLELLDLEDDNGYCGQTGISGSYIEPGRYDLYEDDDCVDTGYDVYVKSTVEKDGGDETIGVDFRLLDDEEPIDGTGPKICKIVIKGGSGTKTYTREENSDCFDTNETTNLLLAPEKP